MATTKKKDQERHQAFRPNGKTAAELRDEQFAKLVAPENSDDPAAKPPKQSEIDAPAPVINLQGGVVTVSVGGNTTALSTNDAIRLGKELARAVQASHPIPESPKDED